MCLPRGSGLYKPGFPGIENKDPRIASLQMSLVALAGWNKSHNSADIAMLIPVHAGLVLSRLANSFE